MGGPPAPARGGMSLYANLLETNADSASISRDPVRFGADDPNDAPARKAIDPALRFQPIRRPQAKQPPKPKTAFHKPPPAPAAAAAAQTGTAVPGNGASAPSSAAAAALPRSTLADWAATEDDEFLYNAAAAEKRQRGGRRKKRKKVDDAPLETDWDELYDPARPTNVEEYLRSEERIQEVREWKAVLYAHRRRGRGGRMVGDRREDSYDSEMVGSEEDEDEDGDRRPMNQFAPPHTLSFAPPPLSPPRAAVVEAATGDDAYARRLALSATAPPPAISPPPPPPESKSEPPAPSTATISRAPVRYEAPPPPPPPPPPADDGGDGDAMDLDATTSDDEVNYDAIPPPSVPFDSLPASDTAPSTNRPGQAGFAQRLMAKYGWTRGSGLGADESGMTSALRVQVEKRRKRPDAEGGGFAEPGGRGRIIAGKTKQANKEANEDGGGGAEGKFGRTSPVIVLQNMLEGMADLETEIELGLLQEIGEECGDKYGRVERLYIDRGSRRVFIKFTDQVSALRAVNALEGRIFNGNAIMPRFWDSDKFENGVYS
ncbi:hypothetical protein B0H67DRAFT_206725 [Lasiosphaeris hirsuta]|uniref:G-patch domain-containing protein n=1 Tax=Lasiosphaeris hirsuta TaxID=260670 RepID=A0AA40ARZ2_9PEZI|nr:hypothetical protein B0H67DRAFT_206725 [Lasiosphaeris hirsuta]